MAEKLKLDSTIQIDNTDYEVQAVLAETANKVANKLTINTIKSGGSTTETVEFDGSKDTTVNINVSDFITEIPAEYVTELELANPEYLTGRLPLKTINDQSIIGEGNITVAGSGGNGGNADKIQVTMNDDNKAYATITIKSSDPSGGKVGDIWFKY